MPPRNPELPEGTDHIINGAMDTGTTGATTGVETGGGAPGGDGGGFIGGGGGGIAAGDDTGGTTLAGSTSIGASGEDLSSSALSGAGGGSNMASGGTGGSGGGGGGAPVKQQLREGVDTVRQQAGEKIRTYAVTGKDRATSALDDLSQVVNDAAGQIEERLGAQYGDYARRAAGGVSDFAETLRNKDVDELFDDAREIVRKSPGVAIGAAAVVGFTLVRLIKAGLDADGTTGGGGTSSRGGSRGGNVEFEPEGGRNIDFQPAVGSGGSSSGQGS